MSDINIYTCTGYLGAEPERLRFKNGNEIVTMRVAVSESWSKDGERKERTLWIPVKISNTGLITVACKYLSKGSRVALQGKLETESWEKDGEKRFKTVLVLGPFNSAMTLLDSKSRGPSGEDDYGQPSSSNARSAPAGRPQAAGGGSIDDSEIPF